MKQRSMKRITLLCMLFLITAALLAGCGQPAESDSAEALGTVTLTVTGYEDAANLPETEVPLTEGMTALDILDASGFAVVKSDGFVESIDGLTNAMEGYPNSGWLYYVNGESPTTGASEYALSDGDAVQWKFVTDFTLLYQ